jgi:hypothetical protein
MSDPVNHSKETKEPADPPLYRPPATTISSSPRRPRANKVIEAGNVRARDEQEMQNLLQSIQLAFRIYNSEIEPEHDTDYYCNCAIHQYKRRKINRLDVQAMWSKAVMYPGEKAYHDCYQATFFLDFSNSNPYRFRVVSPYGYNTSKWRVQRPRPRSHAMSVQQTIQMNATLNAEAQAAIDAKEPPFSIWELDQLASSSPKMTTSTASPALVDDKKPPVQKRQSIAGSSTAGDPNDTKSPKFSGFKKILSIKSPEEKAVIKQEKAAAEAEKRAAHSRKLAEKRSIYARELRNTILAEEQGQWPDQEWRQIVAAYQEKVGMTRQIASLRARRPIQYLHLLRAGYFEPIPVAWANLVSNPLKFSIEAAAGWRGITPAWRGYEDTAEERLYWVLNHREGSAGVRMKPDIISALNMARARMASAVEPPPAYYSADDTCHLQHTSEGYSKQVMPPPFNAFDAPEVPTDDTMILLDVSGSMDFEPLRPNYDQYLITGYSKSTQPKNKGELSTPWPPINLMY